MNYAISRLHVNDDDMPVSVNCIECGKEYKIPKAWKDRKILLCSQKCKEAYRQKHPSIRKKKETAISICRYCGRSFEGTGTYCSNDCCLRHRKEKALEGKLTGDIKLYCKVCGKEYLVHKDKPTKPEMLPKCCSNECRKLLQIEGGKKGSEVVRKSIDVRKLQRQQDAESKKKRDIISNGLCSYCKTNYTDCERMQSEFRVIPKGARFNNSGKIIKCPKFKG